MMSQLHQWVLWHRELELPSPISLALRKRCLAAFVATPTSPSRLQREVVAALTEHGECQEDCRTEEGYSIDGLVLWKGKQVAVEVDGPTHFSTGNATTPLQSPTKSCAVEDGRPDCPTE